MFQGRRGSGGRSLEDSGFNAGGYWKGQACPWVPHVALGGQRRTGVGRTQPFTAQAFTTERNHLPGPTHPLTPLCSVKTLLCENCARVAPLAEKHACTSSSTSTNPLVCVWRVCAHVFFLRGGRNSWFQKEVSHYQQEHRLACLPVKNKAVCSLLELHSGLASRRKRVLSVLTQHMRFADICSATEASSTALKHISPLCCWTGLNGATVGAERPPLTHPMRKKEH